MCLSVSRRQCGTPNDVLVNVAASECAFHAKL
jgi:hypothetical protein